MAATARRTITTRPDSRASDKAPTLVDQNHDLQQINKGRILTCLTRLNDKATHRAAAEDLEVIVNVSLWPRGAWAGIAGPRLISAPPAGLGR